MGCSFSIQKEKSFKLKIKQVLTSYSLFTFIIMVQGWHIFEIYMMVSETHKNVDLILGIKNIVEFEALIIMRELKFKFINRSVPYFLYTKKWVDLRK